MTLRPARTCGVGVGSTVAAGGFRAAGVGAAGAGRDGRGLPVAAAPCEGDHGALWAWTPWATRPRS